MNSLASVNDIAELLREATRPAHRALDHHPLLAPLIDPNLSQTAYSNALAALHGPQRAIERLLSRFAPKTDFPSRLADLESDLENLGVFPVALLADLPRLASVDQLIGAMYVIEGSNLGGAVIARLIDKSLPATIPRQFFRNSGGHARWEKFWHFAATHCQKGSAKHIADAACQTFELYKAHLDRCLRVLKENSHTY